MRLFPILLVCALLPALAQTRKPSPKDLPPSAFKLISIKVTGSQRYKPEEIATTTGLPLGQPANEEDFKAALRVLADTGAFSDLSYTFQYSPEGTRLEIQVQDAKNFVPVRFDNYVWFSDQELLDKLRAQVPLFQGELPVTGNLADQVSEALQTMLIQKSVHGQADYLRFAPQDGPISAFVFSVSGPLIRIRNVEFSGASPAELPALQAAAKPLQGADYVRAVLRVQADKTFLPVYLERGYLKASFGNPQVKVVQDTPEETGVDITFPVEPGRQYKLADLQFSGYKAFPLETLRQLIHQQLNQPVNSVQIDSDLDAVRNLYGTGGFMTAQAEVKPELDDPNSSAKYVIEIREGDVYTMGELEIQGLDSQTSDRLQNAWTLHSGERYDSSYPRRFVERVYKDISTMGDWRVSVRQSVNPKDKTVDLTLRFDPKR